MSLPHDGARPGRRKLLAAAGAALALPFVGSARAQGAWPNRPVSFVVPFPAGGGTDAFARPEFKIARHEEVLGEFLLPSLEVAGPGMHWVEVSRAIASHAASLSAETERMLEAYLEYYEAARGAMRPGATCHDVHREVSAGFTERGYHLGHVTGHSIGMTMIEFPKVGEGVETELAENMVFSMHPHAIAANGEDCLYMQDTWLVTADGGVPLSNLPMQVFRAGI